MGGFYRNDPATSNVFGETVRGKVPKKQCFLPRSYIILIYFVLNRSLLRVLESLFGTGLHCVPYSKNCMLGCLPCWSHWFACSGKASFPCTLDRCVLCMDCLSLSSPSLNFIQHIVPFVVCTCLCSPGFLVEDSAPDFFIQDCLLHEAVCFYCVIFSIFFPLTLCMSIGAMFLFKMCYSLLKTTA